MSLLFGSAAFTPKKPEVPCPPELSCYNALSRPLNDIAFKPPVIVINRGLTDGKITLLYAFYPGSDFPPAGPEAEKHLKKLIENRLDGDLSASLKEVGIETFSEAVFMSELKMLFMQKNAEGRAAMRDNIRALEQIGNTDFSLDSRRILDIIFAYYQPPANSQNPDAPPSSPPAGNAPEKPKKAVQSEKLRSFFEKLNALTGLSEFKTYIREMEAIRPYLSKWKSRRDFPAQHLLFAVDSGNGCTTALTMLREYLAETGLYACSDTNTHLKMKECHHRYPPEDAMQAQLLQDDLSAFEDIILENAPGVIAVHIEEWLDKMESPHFLKFLKLCREHRQSIVFVFIVPGLEEGVLARVCSRLSDILNVRLVRFHPYTAEELTLAAQALLSSYDIGWDKSADAPFRHLLAEERRDNQFHGMRTIDKLGTELVLMKAKNLYVRHINTAPDKLTAADFDAAFPSEEGGDGFEKLDRLIGLTEVKKRVRELVVSIQAEKELAGSDGNASPPCLHMMFTGSPGTGKTTVARLIGQIFREAGLLSRGDLIEVNRFDLVGEFIGTTGPKTVQCCRNAMGSVLFIDEAYLLCSANDEANARDFGREALGALVAEMENNRDRFMVIMAGYGEEMDDMLKANPGLRGRIPHILHFPNYSREELAAIFKAQLKDYDFDDAFMNKADSFFRELNGEFMSGKEFGNARFVRNLVERLRIKALLRLQDVPKTPGEKIRLKAVDIESALADEDMRRINQKEKKIRIGFAG